MISPYIDNLDYILIMSVFPGFGGQSFIYKTLETMRALVDITKNHDILIGVDGGVNPDTISKVYKTGIDVSIVGSALFGSDNIHAKYKELLNV